MPVSPCKLIGEIFGDREGEPFSAERNGFTRRYVRKFRVYSPDKRLASVAIAYTDGLPVPWAFYESGDGLEYDLMALNIRMTAKEEFKDDWQYWIVTVEYNTEVPASGEPEMPGYPNLSKNPGSGNSAANNPEMEPPELEWDFEVVNKARQFDLDGKAFLNSAGVPFDPQPTFEVGFPVLTLTRNELSFDVRKASKYAHSVNSEAFLGFPPGSVLCLPPRSRRMYKGPTAYHKTTYRLKFWADILDDFRDVAFRDKKKDPFQHPVQRARKWADIMSVYGGAFGNGWQPRILDAGTYQRIPAKNSAGEDTFKLVECTVNGKSVTSPVCLDGQGRQQPPFRIRPKEPPGKDNPEVIDPTYLMFRVYKQTDFKKLLVRGLS